MRGGLPDLSERATPIHMSDTPLLNSSAQASRFGEMVSALTKAQMARAPRLLETSLPGVFAVGDVGGGSLKRVASAVGEGAIAVAFVHQALHE
jgi:thioredoxin reductase (NADPH)